MMVQMMTLSVGLASTILLNYLLSGTIGIYIAFGIITGVSVLLALVVRTYFLPI